MYAEQAQGKVYSYLLVPSSAIYSVVNTDLSSMYLLHQAFWQNTSAHQAVLSVISKKGFRGRVVVPCANGKEISSGVAQVICTSL